MGMGLIEKIYFTTWLTSTFLSLHFVYINQTDYEFLHDNYRRNLFQPWKLFTFLIAITLITVVAPYSGDPTWDYADSILISINEFLLAPWSIAVICRNYKSRQFNRKFFVAVCAFLSPCWLYDLYILWRDHSYPSAWFPNIGITIAITLAAGLFWNLSWDEKQGTHFEFSNPNWPSTPRPPLKKIAIPAILIFVVNLLKSDLLKLDVWSGNEKNEIKNLVSGRCNVLFWTNFLLLIR